MTIRSSGCQLAAAGGFESGTAATGALVGTSRIRMLYDLRSIEGSSALSVTAIFASFVRESDVWFGFMG